MKKSLVFFAIFAAFFAGYLLSRPQSVAAAIKTATAWNVSGPTVTTENDAYISVTGISIDWIAQKLTVSYASGNATLNGSNTASFTPGSAAPTFTVTFDAKNGIWSSSTGASGTMTSGEASAVSGILSGASNSVVNPAESFAISHNLFGSGALAYPYPTGVTP